MNSTDTETVKIKKLDLQNLSPGQVAKIVNEISPGLITAMQVQYHIRRAEFSLGDKNKIDLIFYIAWLRTRLRGGETLKRKKPLSAGEIMRARRADIRDIGEIPKIKNRQRRKACERKLALWLKTYMPQAFPLPWSQDHLKVLEKTERCILFGGLYAEGVFRGFGKTTMIEGASIWAACNGHRKMVPVIAAAKKAYKKNMASIQQEFTENELIAEDFPEICYPIRAMEKIPQRAQFLTFKGRAINMEWEKGELIVLPFIPGSLSAGVVILAHPITGEGIRGMKHKRLDGKVIRPDFFIIDDIQTRESAESVEQCDKRERILTGDVLQAGSRTEAVSAVVTTTIIRKGDLADRLLDRELHPEFQGDVFPMVKKWAKRNDDLWMREYSDLRRQIIPDHLGGRDEAKRQATQFYRKNKKKMDEGCEVSWEEIKYHDEISSIQHSYNLRIDFGDYVFQAEYQNAPLDRFGGKEPPLEPKDVLAKLNGLDRYQAPEGTTKIVAFLDVGSETHLHVSICAFDQTFSGSILDYFVEEVKRPPRGGMEAAITTALKNAVSSIWEKKYKIVTGGELHVDKILIDSGWQTQVIYKYCRSPGISARSFPSKGYGGETVLRPPTESLWDANEAPEPRWYVAWTGGKEPNQKALLIHYDADYWKSFVEERIRTPIGGAGCLSIWGKSKPGHLLFGEHLTAERATIKERRDGVKFKKFKVLPGRPNHWGDTVVGCYVGAATLGLRLGGENISPPKPPRPKRPPPASRSSIRTKY